MECGREGVRRYSSLLSPQRTDLWFTTPAHEPAYPQEPPHAPRFNIEDTPLGLAHGGQAQDASLHQEEDGGMGGGASGMSMSRNNSTAWAVPTTSDGVGVGGVGLPLSRQSSTSGRPILPRPGLLQAADILYELSQDSSTTSSQYRCEPPSLTKVAQFTECLTNMSERSTIQCPSPPAHSLLKRKRNKRKRRQSAQDVNTRDGGDEDKEEEQEAVDEGVMREGMRTEKRQRDDEMKPPVTQEVFTKAFMVPMDEVDPKYYPDISAVSDEIVEALNKTLHMFSESGSEIKRFNLSEESIPVITGVAKVLLNTCIKEMKGKGGSTCTKFSFLPLVVMLLVNIFRSMHFLPGVVDWGPRKHFLCKKEFYDVFSKLEPSEEDLERLKEVEETVSSWVMYEAANLGKPLCGKKFSPMALCSIDFAYPVPSVNYLQKKGLLVTLDKTYAVAKDVLGRRGINLAPSNINLSSSERFVVQPLLQALNIDKDKVKEGLGEADVALVMLGLLPFMQTQNMQKILMTLLFFSKFNNAGMAGKVNVDLCEMFVVTTIKMCETLRNIGLTQTADDATYTFRNVCMKEV